MPKRKSMINISLEDVQIHVHGPGLTHHYQYVHAGWAYVPFNKTFRANLESFQTPTGDTRKNWTRK